MNEQHADLTSPAEPTSYTGGPGPEFSVVVTADGGARVFGCKVTRTSDDPVRWVVVEMIERDAP